VIVLEVILLELGKTSRPRITLHGPAAAIEFEQNTLKRLLCCLSFA